jgi:capsular polysaccharide biosynthesis protein
LRKGAVPDGGPAGLTSLPFLGAVLRRHAWVWCACGIAGLAVSAGLFVVAPPAYQAQTSILVTNDTVHDPAVQMQGDLELAENAQVAESAMRQLGIRKAVGSFLTSYTVGKVSDQVMQITTMARSQDAAVTEANALATQFLRFRAYELAAQQRLGVAAIRPLLARARQQFDAVVKQLSRLSAHATPPGRKARRHRKAELRHLQIRYRRTGATLGAFYYTLTNYPVVTASMVQGTRVLDPAAPVPPSRWHVAAISMVAGLVGGLGLGVGLVVIGALVSDSLRRRDDISRALCAPVRSVGRVGLADLLPRRRGPSIAGGGESQRLADRLGGAMPGGERVRLAVLAVGNTRLVAQALVCLAASCARHGRRIMIADLSDHARAGRLLGRRDPGLHVVTWAPGSDLVVSVPEPGDAVPVGPVVDQAMTRRACPAMVTAAAQSADVLFTLATFDPQTGVEQLATWATDVAVVMTAGRSAPTTIRAIGEMVRAAGLHLACGVLIGADRSDESLGFARPQAGGFRPSRI